jgi:hypothetical protein
VRVRVSIVIPLLLSMVCEVALCQRAAVTPASESDILDWPASDVAAQALGLSRLDAAGPRNSREIRIWVGAALVVPYRLVRLVNQGGRVEGLAGWYWNVDDRSHGFFMKVPVDSMLRYQLAGSCTKARRVADVEACRAYLRGPPDWRRLWDTLEALGAWRLPDQHDLPRDSLLTVDGWGMTVQLRDGPRYRSYSYNNPRVEHHPAERAASAIADVVDDVWRVVAPSKHRRRVSGRITIRGNSWPELRMCGSDASWGVGGTLTPALDSLRYPQGGGSAPGGDFYIEAFGMPLLQGMAQMWGVPYPRVFEVDSVVSTGDWNDRRCSI